ncbi:hypothetical protein EJ04DRAFT_6917 [Polyplosphaeria fusca]|uniref:C2H2-type domain-containing protein n=1 Tax=Polyplosphaeria fusca TaxID=682080 RepID=A0A9P4V7Y3_9PLEO|nr:hypothetical protein EJ04DRAFT_6917 [Polyplosphaeria fusca]
MSTVPSSFVMNMPEPPLLAYASPPTDLPAMDVLSLPNNDPQKPLNAVSPLNNIPADIGNHRALLFALDSPVQLTSAVWDRFWPYIDNIWCVHQKPQRTSLTGNAKVYGACRLNRKTRDPPPGEKIRTRQRREGGTCGAKFRLTILPDGRRLLERTGEAHTHSLEHIDSMKRNTGVRNLVLDDFFRSWEAGGILAFLRDTTKEEPHRDILKEAGGLYMSRQEVQNVLNSAWKKAYPGQDIGEVKRQMDKYKNYTTCRHKGCNAPAFADVKALMDHSKTVHGFKSHDHSDKLYACPVKTCWRRKKSKGFATMLSLEEHLRERHPEHSSAPPPQSMSETTMEDTNLDSILDSQLPLPMPLPMTLGLGTSTTYPSYHNLMADPITSESGHEVHIQEYRLRAERQEANGLSTHMERVKMKARIKRLMIERQKLDAEIKRLNKAVYGTEEGEYALAMEHQFR